MKKERNKQNLKSQHTVVMFSNLQKKSKLKVSINSHCRIRNRKTVE